MCLTFSSIQHHKRKRAYPCTCVGVWVGSCVSLLTLLHLRYEGVSLHAKSFWRSIALCRVKPLPLWELAISAVNFASIFGRKRLSLCILLFFRTSGVCVCVCVFVCERERETCGTARASTESRQDKRLKHLARPAGSLGSCAVLASDNFAFHATWLLCFIKLWWMICSVLCFFPGVVNGTHSRNEMPSFQYARRQFQKFLEYVKPGLFGRDW
jgi:hypothetical protein